MNKKNNELKIKCLVQRLGGRKKYYQMDGQRCVGLPRGLPKNLRYQGENVARSSSAALQKHYLSKKKPAQLKTQM